MVRENTGRVFPVHTTQRAGQSGDGVSRSSAADELRSRCQIRGARPFLEIHVWVVHFAILFVVGLVMDVLWAWNVQATVSKRAKTAATVSSLLVLGSVLSIGDILEHGAAPLLGYVAGSWVGTYLFVRR